EIALAISGTRLVTGNIRIGESAQQEAAIWGCSNRVRIFVARPAEGVFPNFIAGGIESQNPKIRNATIKRAGFSGSGRFGACSDNEPAVRRCYDSQDSSSAAIFIVPKDVSVGVQPHCPS